MAKTVKLSALDIGTTSIKFLTGEKEIEKGKDEIVLLSQSQIPCFGVRKGEIFDPQKIAQIISKLKVRLERTNKEKVKRILTSINGPHLFATFSQGLVSVSRADQKISQQDIERVFKACEAINLPSNKEILEVIPQEFIVDGEGGIDDPIGLEGIRLEAKVLLIGGFSPVIENLEKAISQASLEIEEIIPSPLASARAVLNEEQKELGVAMVEIGGGTTSLCVFCEGKLKEFSVFPLGSTNITNDIAICLRTNIKTAEKIKLEFATLKREEKKKKKSKKIEIPEFSLSFSEKFLREIVEARVDEIFTYLRNVLKKVTKHTLLPGGVVFTGGGSLLPGLVEYGKEKLNLPCYLSGPKNVINLEDPRFATCAGMLFLGFDRIEEEKDLKKVGGIKERLRRIFEMFIP